MSFFGVASVLAAEASAFDSVNHAPVEPMQSIVADPADDGTITRGWLGVQIKPMPEDITQVLGFDKPMGVMIETISADSPATEAGLKQCDIILSFNETEITELSDLSRAAAAIDPEVVVPVRILHKGEEKAIDVTIGTMPTQGA